MRQVRTAVLVVLLLASACSGGDDEPEATGAMKGSTSSTRASSSTTTTTTITAPTATTASTPPPRLTTDSVIHVRGVGPVVAGMTLKEAEAAGGAAMTNTEGEFDAFEGLCYHAQPKGVDGVAFMVGNERRPADPKDGRIVRATVAPYGPEEALVVPGFVTDKGVGLGSTEAQVKAAYPGIEVTGHQYVEQGHYLTLYAAGADKGFGIRFETDGQQVTSIHAGKADAIQFVEGCA